MITIKPTGGLCNYLRVVFSWYQHAKHLNLELNVIWIKTKWCPGHFLDYFEPIKNINFINDVEEGCKINYHGCKCHPGYHQNRNYIYGELKLKPSLQKIVDDKLELLNKNYISVHIRRTDHLNYQLRKNVHTDDEQFINFINNSDDNKNIYIATDNKGTYNNFKSKYPERIKFDYHETDNNSYRKTSLQDAIIDIYMCVYSDDFMGTNCSSFSDLIHKLKNAH